jgi:hypothetical protein
MGYAIGEVYIGTIAADGSFQDILKHSKTSEQTHTTLPPWIHGIRHPT